jgi:galactose-1-phosphate uridylyltransferase
MRSESHLDPKELLNLVQVANIDELSLTEIAALFREEIHEARYLPDLGYQIDPRTGDRILYHSARSSRGHDNRPEQTGRESGAGSCLICAGSTTGIIDVAQLSEGFTFINKNLFPVLYPFDESLNRGDSDDRPAESITDSHTARGLHFLQWTSSFHSRDWHNMPHEDAIKVMRRLAVLERKLMRESIADERRERDGRQGEAERRFVLIVKNYGHLVGGSLSHGHQQIALSNVMPRRFKDDERFEDASGIKFSGYMMKQNPADLVVRDYGPAILLVPHFMRRPYDMMLLLKETAKRHLYELSADEIAAVASGWQDAIKAIHTIMPQLGRETAFNAVTHNGPGAGLYFEFLPYTQETGGFEHLGLIVCQADPFQAAARLRNTLSVS